MATRVIESRTDDITGEEGAEPFRFGLDGKEYEIDLVDWRAEELRRTFEPYVHAAHRVRPDGLPAPTRRTLPADRQRSQDIRQWAREQGLQVNERGRISAEVIAKYEAAH
jgi:hypothetical protein